jgi:predicted hydrocarbon binding protein
MSSRVSTDRAPSPGRQTFHADPESGSIRLGDDARVLAIPEALVRELHFAIIQQLGERAQDALYRMGYEWALQTMLQQVRDMRAQASNSSFDFWQQPLPEVLTGWWTSFATLGWGAATFDFQASARQVVFVDLRQSIVADAMPGADNPVCHLYAGLFAGVLSFFTRTERHAVEIACTAMGHNNCQFVIGPGAEVDAAETWRQQGTAAPEILRRFT